MTTQLSSTELLSDFLEKERGEAGALLQKQLNTFAANYFAQLKDQMFVFLAKYDDTYPNTPPKDKPNVHVIKDEPEDSEEPIHFILTAKSHPPNKSSRANKPKVTSGNHSQTRDMLLHRFIEEQYGEALESLQNDVTSFTESYFALLEGKLTSLLFLLTQRQRRLKVTPRETPSAQLPENGSITTVESSITPAQASSNASIAPEPSNTNSSEALKSEDTSETELPAPKRHRGPLIIIPQFESPIPPPKPRVVQINKPSSGTSKPRRPPTVLWEPKTPIISNIISLKCFVADCKIWRPSELSLQQHLESAHGIKRNLCHQLDCGASFASSPELEAHLTREHATITAYTCFGCRVPFRTYHTLVSHFSNTHITGLFRCGLGTCKTVSSTRGDLARHRKEHATASSTAGTYQCRVEGCGASFNNHCQLGFHQRTHKVSFGCTWEGCSYSAPKRRLALLHIRFKHLQVPRELHSEAKKVLNPEKYLREIEVVEPERMPEGDSGC